MPKMTLLEMTQNILSSMNSDEVNSITDTVESQQVAEEIRNTYYELYTNRDIPELEGLINLEASSDPLRPNTLVVPSGVSRIKWIKYLDFRPTNPSYKEIEYLQPEEFLQRVVEAGPTTTGSYTNVRLTDTSPVEYTISSSKAPDFYTIFNNDDALVFDSFDYGYETNLTGANSLAWGFLNTDFDMTDGFIPPIDANLFPHFLAEAKAACFINIKEVANSNEERRARRQLVRSQIRLNKTNAQRQGALTANDYSRKR